jgi:hypothetical protein
MGCAIKDGNPTRRVEMLSGQVGQRLSQYFRAIICRYDEGCVQSSSSFREQVL